MEGSQEKRMASITSFRESGSGSCGASARSSGVRDVPLNNLFRARSFLGLLLLIETLLESAWREGGFSFLEPPVSSFIPELFALFSVSGIDFGGSFWSGIGKVFFEPVSFETNVLCQGCGDLLERGSKSIKVNGIIRRHS